MGERTNPSRLAELYSNTTNIRNFCIIAHVDHGKTSLSDSLISSNGLISRKLAGKLRYLDSTEEEQRRGITMHSSAISLIFEVEASTTESKESYLINLIDSPGHIDFSSDVSTATRLCDGALIVVDAVEGVCTQTHAVLFKALKDGLHPCLVLNKVDRLLLEMQLNSIEAFQHLRRLVENVNALSFSLVTSELRRLEEETSEAPSQFLEETMRERWAFSPDSGNVIFTSALDSWGFSVARFANIWARKLGVKGPVLRKYMFEDCYFNPKTQKIMKCDRAADPSIRPMFASMILDPIWLLYETALLQCNPEKAAKMAQRALEIEALPQREINMREPRLTLQAIMRRWLPLSDAVLKMAVKCMPNPIQAQSERLESFFGNSILRFFSSRRCDGADRGEMPTTLTEEINQVIDSFSVCSTSEKSHTVVFVSKMTPVKISELSARDQVAFKRQIVATAVASSSEMSANGGDDCAGRHDDTEAFVALARVFSGTLTTDTELYVLGRHYNPLENSIFDKSDQQECTNDACTSDSSSSLTKIPPGSIGLYSCLGPSVYPVNAVPAGNIAAIFGLDKYVLKSATLSSTRSCPPLRAMTFQAKPIVCVAVEPISHKDLNRLEKGLESLFQFDPAVEIGVDSKGQHTMTCLGELHLEQCIKSLTDRFARCPIKVSDPLVSYRETVAPGTEGPATTSLLPPPWSDLPRLADARNGQVSIAVVLGAFTVHLGCKAMPVPLLMLLEKYRDTAAVVADIFMKYGRRASSHIELQLAARADDNTMEVVTEPRKSTMMSTALLEFVRQYMSAFSDQCSNKLDRTLAIGPEPSFTNVLTLDNDLIVNVYPVTTFTDDPTILAVSLLGSFRAFTQSSGNNHENAVGGSVSENTIFGMIWDRLHNSFIAGFLAAAEAGPLMHEPLHGVLFSVTKIDITLSMLCAVSDRPREDILSLLTLSNNKDPFLLPAAPTGGESGCIISAGHLIAEVRDACRLAVLSLPVRIVEPVLAGELQCDQSQLGNLYGVLSKRRGKVSNEDVIDGTTLFLLSISIPVSKSFGFAQELLEKTSGRATAPQLVFSHWSVVDLDPFWRPRTEAELEDYGTDFNDTNEARVCIDSTRKRKGLTVEEKIVISAEKQRTLKR